MTSVGCPYCYKLEVLLCETIGQRNDVIKSKMAARGKLKKGSIFRFDQYVSPLSDKICNLDTKRQLVSIAEIPFKILSSFVT